MARAIKHQEVHSQEPKDGAGRTKPRDDAFAAASRTLNDSYGLKPCDCEIKKPR